MLSAKALQQQVNGYIRMKKPTWAGKYGVASPASIGISSHDETFLLLSLDRAGIIFHLPLTAPQIGAM